MKFSVMAQILVEKFRRWPELRRRLVETYPKRLEEKNHWGDRYWGCDHVSGGENNLGKILEVIRECLRKDATLEAQLEATQKQAAQMRDALEFASINAITESSYQRYQQALSLDAGKGYVSVEKVREAIEYAMSRHLTIGATIETALEFLRKETQ